MLAVLVIIAALLTSWATWHRWRLRQRLPQAGGANWNLWLAQGLLLLALGCIGAGARKTRIDTSCIAFLLDCSESMRAEGVGAQNRLEEGRAAIKRLASLCHGCEVALITYAGTAFVDCPPTSDRAAFEAALEAAGPGVLYLPGSAPEQAVRQAEALGASAMVLVGDGEMNPPDTTSMALWRTRKTPLVAICCGAMGIPRQIPRKNGVLYDEATGQPALTTTTTENVVQASALSDAPFGGVSEATGSLEEASAFLRGLIHVKESPRRFLFYAVVLLFLALCIEPIVRALKERTLSTNGGAREAFPPSFGRVFTCMLGLLVLICSNDALADAPSSIPSTTDAQLDALRAQVRDAGLPVAVRARLYSNLAALLCVRAMRAPDGASESTYEAVHAAREALKLEPGLAAAATNLELAQRLLLQDGTAATSPQAPSEKQTGEGGEHGAQASGAGEGEVQREVKPDRSFGSWRDLQEAAAKRQLRSAPQGVKPW